MKLGQTKTYCSQSARGKDAREKAGLNGNGHQHLIPCEGWLQLSLFYFASHSILHCYLLSTLTSPQKRAELGHSVAPRGFEQFPLHSGVELVHNL